MIHLVIDTPNLLFRVASINNKSTFGSEEEKAGLALHMSFLTIHKYFKKYKPDRLVFTFEGMNNWRKSFSTSPNSVSGIKYKGNRIKDKSMEPFFELMNSFRDVMEKHSNTICISADTCEADDIIGIYVKKIYEENPNDTVIVVSNDRDFMQLYKYPNFSLIDPQTGKDRKFEYENKYGEPFDPEYFMFEKCIRGDKGDNVPSAYPRVRVTRIKKAYKDEYEKTVFMKEKWTNQDDKEFEVGQLFEENKILMDLDSQPDEVKEAALNAINDKIENHGKFNNFYFLKFLGQNGLNSIAENINQYIGMLSCKPYMGISPSPNSNNANISKKKKKIELEDNEEFEDRSKPSNDFLSF